MGAFSKKRIDNIYIESERLSFIIYDGPEDKIGRQVLVSKNEIFKFGSFEEFSLLLQKCDIKNFGVIDGNLKRYINVHEGNKQLTSSICYAGIGMIILFTLGGTIYVVNDQKKNQHLVQSSTTNEQAVGLFKPLAEVYKGTFRTLSLIGYYDYLNGYTKEDRIYNADDFENGILYLKRLFRECNEDISDIQARRVLYTATADDLDLEYRQSFKGTEEANSDDIAETLEDLFKRIDFNGKFRFQNIGANSADYKIWFELDGIRRKIASNGKGVLAAITDFITLVGNSRENISDGALLMIKIELNSIIGQSKNEGFITDVQEEEITISLNNLDLSQPFMDSNKPYSKSHIIVKS